MLIQTGCFSYCVIFPVFFTYYRSVLRRQAIDIVSHAVCMLHIKDENLVAVVEKRKHE